MPSLLSDWSVRSVEANGASPSSPASILQDQRLLSRPQSILVVVRRHCTLQDNLDRIGRPGYKNLKIKKEEKKGRTLYKYI